MTDEQAAELAKKVYGDLAMAIRVESGRNVGFYRSAMLRGRAMPTITAWGETWEEAFASLPFNDHKRVAAQLAALKD